MRTSPALLLLLAGCAGGAADDLSCEAGCPPGTRNALYETAVSGGASVVSAGECESICEPIATCLAPQIPVITQDEYRCVSVEGISSIPADAEVDFSFMQAWDEGGAR